VCTDILLMKDKNIKRYKGNYDAFQQARYDHLGRCQVLRMRLGLGLGIGNWGWYDIICIQSSIICNPIMCQLRPFVHSWPHAA